MAKNDYYVIAYWILAYLYACLKEGVRPNPAYIKADSEVINLSPSYWEYIMRHLYKDGYIDGISLIPVIGAENPQVRIDSNIVITPKGIEYLQNNSAMCKARDFLITLKEIIPGL